MLYYFPININGRRLHFLHLNERSANHLSPEFSFIIKDYDSPLLLSVDSQEAQLISNNGSINNVPLCNYCFKIEESISFDNNIPTYRINIEEGRPEIDPGNKSMLKSKGYIGSDDSCNSACVFIDSTLTKDKNTGAFLNQEFIVIVSYKDKRNNNSYEDAIRFYLYREDSELVSGALDFGSEASQIRFDKSESNIAIIDTLLSFGNNTFVDGDYWQGRPNDNLYKSVFFVNLNPEITKFGDKPKVGDRNVFVKPLMSKAARSEEYNNLELLPNLKLIEISQGTINYNTKTVEFPDDSTIANGSLDTQELRDSILRLILNNFLHCMLKKQCCGREEKLLRMVVLVPNVYYQSKIYYLMRSLYLDYQIIQSGENSYKQCKGFEVQVVSESDASFIGVRHKRQDIKNATNGLFLIIDAGKGTTDFSILQQGKDFSHFCSLYRDGIPASGNVLTYAFF